MNISDATEYDLFKQGLITLAGLDRHRRAIFRTETIFCDHRWSEGRFDVKDEPGYQVCAQCGKVRRYVHVAYDEMPEYGSF